MNVFDFDKTLYPRDSTLEFYLVSLLRHPTFLLDLPRALFTALQNKRGKVPTEAVREAFFTSFRRIKDLESEVERFWEKRERRLYSFYETIRREDDVILSASPAFILRPIARRARYGTLIASRLDERTMRYEEGGRCYGENKPMHFFAHFPEGEIDSFYSDSLSDSPMARLAKHAYLTRGGVPVPWPQEDENDLS